MIKKSIIIFIFTSLVLKHSYALIDFESLYKSWGTSPNSESITIGKDLWSKELIPGKNCASCHTNDLKQSGKHLKTKKIIKPLSPSANKKRLTSERKINKWLKRNCKFTYNRECTPSEKVSFIEYIRTN